MRNHVLQIATSWFLVVGFGCCSSAGLAMADGGAWGNVKTHVAQMPSGGGGGEGGAAPPRRSTESPEQVAASRYKDAQRARDRALAYEEEARGSDEAGFFGLGARPSEKALRQWRKAVAAYNGAIRTAPDRYYPAHSEVCLAHRKLGNHEKSLASADRALQRIPGYAPAIECRGQAYLQLSRLSQAREDYERLRRLNSELADQLMDAMKAWLARNREDPADGLSLAEVEAFRKWVQERDELASRSEGPVSGVRSP